VAWFGRIIMSLCAKNCILPLQRSQVQLGKLHTTRYTLKKRQRTVKLWKTVDGRNFTDITKISEAK